MEPRAVYVRVGLLIIGIVAAVAGLVLFLGGQQIRNGRLFESYFKESVQGLEVGSSVKYRGVSVGQVTEIGLVNAVYAHAGMSDPRNDLFNLVLVRYKIDLARVGPNVETEQAIKAGLRAKLASQGITGLSYIELDFVDPARYPVLHVPWTPLGDYIPSIPSTFVQVQDAAQQLLAKLDSINFEGLVESLGGLADEVRVDLASGDLHALISETTATVRDLHAALQALDPKGLASDLSGAAKGLRQLTDSKETHGLLVSAAAAAERLSAAAAKLPALLATSNEAVGGVNNSLADLEAQLIPILRDTRAALQNLRDTTEALRRYPAGVLFGGPPPRQEPGR
jgi:paraquat-inducible protein B